MSKELIAAWDPFHPVVEELRARAHPAAHPLVQPRGRARARSPSPAPSAREGRSFVAANLAVVFSQLGQRTLLIDADFRAPRQQSIFNIPDRFGLSSALSGRADLSAAAPVSGLAGLSVMPAGPVPPNPLELLSRASFARAARQGAVRVRRDPHRHAAGRPSTPTRRRSRTAPATRCWSSRKDQTRDGGHRARGARAGRRQRAHRRHADERVLKASESVKPDRKFARCAAVARPARRARAWPAGHRPRPRRRRA